LGIAFTLGDIDRGIQHGHQQAARDNARKRAMRKRSQLKTKMQGEAHWTKRNKGSGQFMDQKKSATTKPFKGVRREQAD
jgi:hypothetical protein